MRGVSGMEVLHLCWFLLTLGLLVMSEEAEESVHGDEDGLPYLGPYAGRCIGNGMYYLDEKSFVVCSNDFGFIQPCAAGSRNAPIDTFRTGGKYSFQDFCGINVIPKAPSHNSVGSEEKTDGDLSEVQDYDEGYETDWETLSESMPINYESFEETAWKGDGTDWDDLPLLDDGGRFEDDGTGWTDVKDSKFDGFEEVPEGLYEFFPIDEAEYESFLTSGQYENVFLEKKKPEIYRGEASLIEEEPLDDDSWNRMDAGKKDITDVYAAMYSNGEPYQNMGPSYQDVEYETVALDDPEEAQYIEAPRYERLISHPKQHNSAAPFSDFEPETVQEYVPAENTHITEVYISKNSRHHQNHI